MTQESNQCMFRRMVTGIFYPGHEARRALVSVLALSLALLPLTATPTRANPGTTERVSVDGAGSEGNAPSGAPGGSRFDMPGTPALSGDGRFVAFESIAGNLSDPSVDPDTNGVHDIFVRDRLTGATERVSVASDGTQGNAPSQDPSTTADGRYVVFQSGASNLVTGDLNQRTDIFVHDRQSETTELVSVNNLELQGVGASTDPEISDDGRFVAFASWAALAPGDVDSVIRDIFVRDRVLGTTEKASVSSTGIPSNWNSYSPSISADGRFVAFHTLDELVAEDTGCRTPVVGAVTGDLSGGACPDVYVRDVEADTTELVSEGGSRLTTAFDAQISPTGRYVVFETKIPWSIQIHDRQTDTIQQIALDGTTSPFDVACEDGQTPSISADGRLVAFGGSTRTTSTCPEQDRIVQDRVWVHDVGAGESTEESVDSNGAPGNAASRNAMLSDDGSLVAFASDATNLVADDANAQSDVFVHQLSAHGSAPGSIAGTVTEGKGNKRTPIAGATVDCGVAGTAASAADGGYRINNVAPSTYSCTASATGFELATKTVTVAPGEETIADFTLRRITGGDPSPSPSPSPTFDLSLSAQGYKQNGLQKADLSWSGATSDSIDVYRDTALIVTTENDGSHTDNIDARGGGSYTYKVCEQGTSVCSNEATVKF